MPRNENKKHVGFATHITAGGMAGAMEAVGYPLELMGCSAKRVSCKAMLPATRYH